MTFAKEKGILTDKGNGGKSMTRECTCCRTEKDESEFGLKSGKLETRCKKCKAEAMAKWRAKNPEHNKMMKAKWQTSNAEYVLTKQREWKEKNRAHVNECSKQWRQKNLEHARAWRRAYYNGRMDEDAQFRLAETLRHRLHDALRGKCKRGSAVADLGMSIEEFRVYLESKFKPGMSWKNHGEWHIDHIVPLTWFDLENPEQLKYALRYDNLQPMWAEDNLSKGNRHAV